MSPRPAALWTKEQDDQLCDMLADGHPFSAIAKALGRSRNAVIGRFDRIKAIMGRQAQ